jgi:hypothetical protein
MMAKIFNRNCVMLIAVLFSLISAPSASAAEINAVIEKAFHHLFEEMARHGIDCVRHYETCLAKAPPDKLPPYHLTPAQIDAVQRSFAEKQAATPPTIRVVPAN